MDTNIKHNHSNDIETGNRETIKLSPLGYTIKLLAKWVGFAGLYTAFSVCPFCGRPGCPVGIGSASIVGAFFVLIFQDWKILYNFLKTKINK